MLNQHNRVLYAPDVNTGGESSTSSEGATAQDVNTEVSSTSQTTDVKEEELTREQIRDKAVQQVSSNLKKAEADNAEENTAETGEVKEDTSSTTNKEEELPFGKHPRWIERQKELEELRPMKQRVSELEPLAQQAKQLADLRAANNIDDQTFADAIEIASLFKNNPLAAREKLQQIQNNIDLAMGNKLPDDLQTQVDSGAMPQNYAQELAKARMQLQGVQTSQQNSSKFFAQQQEQGINHVFAMWDQSKRQQDSAFKPKAAANAPDGKWELVNNRLVVLRQANPPRNQQEAVALVERAYTETSAALAQFMPKPTARKNLPSGSSSSTGKARYKSVREAALAIGRGEKVDPSQIEGY